MNPPFQSVGIVFFVTFAHVIVIAIYSSRSLPETSFQKPISAPAAESVEVMPEQLIRDVLSTETNTDPPPEKDHIHSEGAQAHAGDDKSHSEENVKVVVKKESPKPESKPVEKPLEPEKPEVVAESVAKRWEDDAFAKRVSLPTPGGAIEKMPEKLADNKSDSSSKARSPGIAKGEPPPRARTFSPVPRS